MIKNITIKFDTVNSSFEGEDWSFEVSRILKNVREEIKNGRLPEVIKDINGNTIGYVEYERI